MIANISCFHCIKTLNVIVKNKGLKFSRLLKAWTLILCEQALGVIILFKQNFMDLLGPLFQGVVHPLVRFMFPPKEQ